MKTTRSRWVGTLAIYACIVALSFAFRYPALLNAGTVNSDAAIVGLQARHILRGEWSWFLYGSGYQTSVDSLIAAAFFAFFGPTSLALVLSTLVGHVAATCLAFATLRRRIPETAAFVCVLPLVFTSSPLHTYILNPPRQAALTLVFLAVFVIDGASERVGSRARIAQHVAGAALASLAVFADPYALLFLPPLVLLGVLTGLDGAPSQGRWRAAVPRASATLIGSIVGIVPFLVLLQRPSAVHGETTLTASVLGHNLRLLIDPCLPWLLGTTAYVPRALLGYVPWAPGAFVHALQRGGGVLFVVAIMTSGVAFASSRVPWPVRRLGLFGCTVGVLTVCAFLVSVMVMDLFSSRYLAAIILASPFALAPLAFLLRGRRLLFVLAPYIVFAGVSGWLGYGNEVAGAAVIALPGRGASDEQELRPMLSARGVHTAIADYWVSYRLTFLWSEAILVVPIHEREDRYAPYRREYESAEKRAYIYDPTRSRESYPAMIEEAFARDHAWGKPIERLNVGALQVVIFESARTSGAP